MSDRATYLLVSQMHDLEHACRLLTAAFGQNTYQVGSSIQRADYRDVDLRCIMDDEEYDAFIAGNKHRLNFLNACISRWIAEKTGLPVDFQFQRRTEANAEYSQRAGHHRHARGFALDDGPLSWTQ